MSYTISTIRTEERGAIDACFPLFQTLRPHLTLEAFREGVEEQLREGYRISYIELDGKVAAAAGYRTCHFLAWGKILYIDDLIADPELTKRGLGSALLDHLEAIARDEGCAEVHLDTGYTRLDAHRLYLNKGFVLAAHHMARALVER